MFKLPGIASYYGGKGSSGTYQRTTFQSQTRHGPDTSAFRALSCAFVPVQWESADSSQVSPISE